MSQTLQCQVEAGGLAVQFAADVSAADVSAHAEVQPLPGHDGCFTAVLTLASAQAFAIEKLVMRSEFPAADMHGLYHPYGSIGELTMLPFWRRAYESSATQPPPLLAFLHQSGRNRVAFGLADQLTPSRIDYTLSEHTRTIVLNVTKPTDRPLQRTRHVEAVFIATADLPLATLLRAYNAFVHAHQPVNALPVPEAAYDPVFCTWTAIHTEVTPAWTERNAKLARELGFKTLLMDDGWQDWPDDRAENDRLAGGQTYPYNGGWTPHPRKFPDFAAHVKRIQALGMRYLLWVAPFFLGHQSEPYRQLRDKGWLHTGKVPWGGNVFLDPRYPQVQQYVRDVLLRLMNDYGLDGLKIDFVDNVGGRIDPHMAPMPDSAEAGPSLQDLLGGVMDQLRINVPDLMIECRQGYSNLAARRWTNCYRSPDVPINFHQNRFNCAMLRLLVPDAAVYFDPALWPMQDPDENVARHMISAVSAVPMISIEFDRYPQSHLEIVRHWIAFYEQHKQTLMKGGFEPVIRLGHNPVTRFQSDHETIIGLYSDEPILLTDAPDELYLLNGSSRGSVDVLSPDAAYQATGYSRTGQVIAESTIHLPMRDLPVEIGGYVRLRRQAGTAR